VAYCIGGATEKEDRTEAEEAPTVAVEYKDIMIGEAR
jgi:hypothetical protein